MDEKKNNKALVDTRGYSCPISVAMISKAINTVDEGAQIEIISDDMSITKDIEQWCLETGNSITNVVIDSSTVKIEVAKGKGYKAQSFFDLLSFFLLGVRLHIYKFYVSIFKKDSTRFLITFVSVAEGMRAHYWLQQNHSHINYILLPVPNDITRHCGVVMAVSDRNMAKKIFSLLLASNFKVEDIYQKQHYTYHKLAQ